MEAAEEEYKEEPLLKLHRKLTDVEKLAYFSERHYRLKEKVDQLEDENKELRATNLKLRETYIKQNELIHELQHKLDACTQYPKEEDFY